MKRLSWLILLLFILFAACSQTERDPVIDELAGCLADNKAEFYGTYWCHNCKQQKEMFGASFEILKNKGVYIECDPGCVLDSKGNIPKSCDGVVGSAELCLEKNIEGYPTWVFKDGTRAIGTQQFSELAELSGCDLNYD